MPPYIYTITIVFLWSVSVVRITSAEPNPVSFTQLRALQKLLEPDAENRFDVSHSDLCRLLLRGYGAINETVIIITVIVLIFQRSFFQLLIHQQSQPRTFIQLTEGYISLMKWATWRASHTQAWKIGGKWSPVTNLCVAFKQERSSMWKNGAVTKKT